MSYISPVTSLLSFRKLPSKCSFSATDSGMHMCLTILSRQLDSSQAGQYAHIHRASHAFATQIGVSVYYRPDSRNEHALRPLQTQWDTCLSRLNACWDNFLQALLIWWQAAVSPRPSIFIAFSLPVSLPVCLFVFFLRGVNPDWVILLPLFFFSHTTSSSALAGSVFLLYHDIFDVNVWVSVRVRIPQTTCVWWN